MEASSDLDGILRNRLAPVQLKQVPYGQSQ